MSIQHILSSSLRLSLMTVLPAFVLAGCGSSGGDVENTVALATDTRVNLYCPDAGIGGEDCILYDPDNPYARSAINNQTKWDLNNVSPSSKSDFYLWATALALDPTGENQYYTALALQELYTQGGSTLMQSQAQRAYRSVLDNYFDSLTFFDAAPPSDFVADQDFRYSDFGSGTADSGWNGGYTGDSDFSPVWLLPAGNGWGGAAASIAFFGFNAGFAANYQNLVFKVKFLPTNDVWINFSSENDGPSQEVMFSLSQYSRIIEGTDSWREVTIPLSNFPDLASYTAFNIHSGFGNGGTFRLTDVAFTGDATGNGLVKDDNNSGAVELYRSGTQQFSLNLRDLSGTNIYNPGNGMSQLFGSQAEALQTLQAWGYNYDTATEQVTRAQ